MRAVLIGSGGLVALIAGLVGMFRWLYHKARSWGDHPTQEWFEQRRAAASPAPVFLPAEEETAAVEPAGLAVETDPLLADLAHVQKAFQMRLHMAFEKTLQRLAPDETAAGWARIAAAGWTVTA